MNPAPRALPRRTVLAASGTAVLAAAAACSSGTPTASSSTPSASSSTASSSTASSSTATSSTVSSPTTTAPPTTSADPTTAAEPSNAVAAPSVTPPAGPPLASVAEVESAGSVRIGNDSSAIVLAAANGTVVGHTAVCTHMQCVIAANGNCPCHGSKFDVATGAVIEAANGSPPSSQDPLAEVSVTVFDGQVYLA